MSAQQLGFRIRTDYERVPEALVTAARKLPTAVIGDVSHRLFSLPAGFLNYSKAALHMAGPVLTVKVRPGDNLFLHKALDLAQPGDVIVCDAGGGLHNAIIGEMMARYAVSRGVAGIVINGAIRDRAGIVDLPIPVYALGITPNGPWKSGPGEIGYPIAPASLAVSPGDLIVGDEDGVIVLPREDAGAIVDKAQAHAVVEEQWARQIQERTWPRGWVDQALATAG
ncbi:RraA family protein [Burkholderia dolosa]|uniref:RraA family protein n=1 Tax=Burkholderia dolosa TaxID=152500 RepID=UPI001B9239A4|nr:RraA family protein [Burkholderia dolosa]MBR8457092.1 RraA family protein [Burkholderia dolosa]MDN7419409.1 RraA family protein [Burkholderia dolosa]